MKCEIQSYHSNIEVDTNPVHTLSMLMVLLRKEKYDMKCLSYIVVVSRMDFPRSVASQNGHGRPETRLFENPKVQSFICNNSV